MSLGSIPQRIRSLPRLPQIIRVLMRYGFGDVVSRIGIDSALHRLRSWVQQDVDPRFQALSTEARIRHALEDLGPTFVKLGQVMATRPDLVPMGLVLELRQLQDKVKPFDTAGIQALVEEELGRPLDEVFEEFDTSPLAAASIAQVHKATLKGGQKVVLKIQRPHLDRIIETDLVLLYWLAELAHERLPEVRRYDPVGLVTEFHRSITKEIDFETEAYHVKRFAKNFEGDDDVYVPKIFDDLTTSKVLTEELVPGLPLNDPSVHTRGDLDLPHIARTGLRVIVEQALVHGFFHADPHPGNIFVIPETGQIAMIDFGMMGVLDQERIDEILVFLVAILTRDVDKMIRLFTKLELIDEQVDVRALRRDVDELIGRFEQVELSRIDIGRFIQQVFEVIVRHDVQVPSDLLLVGKALATIEGVGRDIYPELDPLTEFRPHILRVYLGRLTDPMFYVRTPRRVVEDLVHLVETAPRDLHLTLRKLREGKLKVKLDIQEYELATRANAQATNRLALSLVIGAVLVSSVYLIANTDLSAYVGDFPLGAVLGLGGVIYAGLLGLVLLVGYIRSGGL